MIRELLEQVVQEMVGNPRAVLVRERRTETSCHLLIAVAPGDRGRVIGRSGDGIRALRTLVKAMAYQDGIAAAHVEIEEGCNA